jgi:hypothetical protein
MLPVLIEFTAIYIATFSIRATVLRKMSLHDMAKRLAETLAAGFIALAICQPVSAALLASTFGPGDTFFGASYPIGNPVLQQEIAAAFTPGITASLETIRVAASFDSGVNNFTVYIAPDVAGEPGPSLESFTALSFPVTPSILTLNSVSHPLLSAESQYWVVMTAPDLGNSQGEWNLNNQGFSGVLARNFFGGFVWRPDPEAATPAFDVSGVVVVPEPCTFGLALAGLAAVMMLPHRRPSGGGTVLRS